MDKAYQPDKTEKKVYARWQKSGGFNPDKLPSLSVRFKKGRPFTIIMPPPNANGELHAGHALEVALQDTIVRYQRMSGRQALWLPGTDHAGILTQVVFERELAKKGLTRFDLGRREFFRQCYQFTMKNKKRIEEQLASLGASCDWSRKAFTLEPRFNDPIYFIFVKLYQDGLLYRGERLINWCPRCQTALSDLEVVYKDQQGRLYYIAYPLQDGSGKVVVATTRPESLLGDAAVAVNPKDKRYKNLVGKKLVLPIAGRVVPVIADSRVDKEFGTGAVKVTPAHDLLDFEIASTHLLKKYQVIGFDGKMTNEAGQGLAGLSVQRAREEVLRRLQELRALEKVEDHQHRVARCERCSELIEPLLSLQWFVKTKKLAHRAIAAVKKGRIEILPERFLKIYYHWLENIQDWCISRQLWWGHQLPVWYCGYRALSGLQQTMNDIDRFPGCGAVVVDTSEPKSCPRCSNTKLIRDPDTLDTWFSSGQWPYNTLGWKPKVKSKSKNQKAKIGDFEKYYPTDVMAPGYEILFFWVARMIMLGLYATDDVPFKTVYLHGLVRDKHGQKMSKSRGNVLDPLKLSSQYGTDALRLSLISDISPGADTTLSHKKIASYRNFVNKLWNIGRFVELSTSRSQRGKTGPADPIPRALVDRWLLSIATRCSQDVAGDMDSFRLGLAVRRLRELTWQNFADWYLEAFKASAASKNLAHPLSEEVLIFVFKNLLHLLHPFAPFVSEVLWRELFGQTRPEQMLMLQSRPKIKDDYLDQRAEKDFELIRTAVQELRELRSLYDMPSSQTICCKIEGNQGLTRLVQGQEFLLKHLASAVLTKSAAPAKDTQRVRLPLGGQGGIVVFLNKETSLEVRKTRLIKKQQITRERLQAIDGQLSDKDFLSRAPSEIIAKLKDQRTKLKKEESLIEQFLEGSS